MPKRRHKPGPYVGPGGLLYDTLYDLHKAIMAEYERLEHIRTPNDRGTEDIGRKPLHDERKKP